MLKVYRFKSNPLLWFIPTGGDSNRKDGLWLFIQNDHIIESKIVSLTNLELNMGWDVVE